MLWGIHCNIALRCNEADPPGTPWRGPNQSLKQFLSLARQYDDDWKKGWPGYGRDLLEYRNLWHKKSVNSQTIRLFFTTFGGGPCNVEYA